MLHQFICSQEQIDLTVDGIVYKPQKSDHSGHFLLCCDWPLVPKLTVIGAFNRKLINYCCRSERALSERARQHTDFVQLLKISILPEPQSMLVKSHFTNMQRAARGFISELNEHVLSLIPGGRTLKAREANKG